MKTRWTTMALAMAMAATTASAAMRAAIFVQNRAGPELESKIDPFADMLAARLAASGFEVVRPQDVLARFSESRRAESEQELRQSIEALQAAKAEGTVDGPMQEASALRIAQLTESDLVVMASLVSIGENRVRTQSYGLTQDVTTKTLRMALRVLDGDRGSQLYGDTVAATEKIVQNANLQVDMGDLVNQLLDRGAGELAERVRSSGEKIAAAKSEPAALANVAVNSTVPGAAVEIDGVVVGTAPGTFRVRPGVHEVRVTREGYATWEKSVAFVDGQTLDVALELSAAGLARKGELEEQERIDDVAREQSAADARAKVVVAEGAGKQMSESYIRLEGMPNESLTLGGSEGSDASMINVIQQESK